VAPFRIVQVPEELAEVLSVEHAVALGYGPAFGSKEQQITELAYSQVSDVPIEMRCSLFVIDHNQSFDPDFDSEKFFKYHAFKDIAPRVFDDLIEREHYTSKMENAIEGGG